MKKKVIRRTQGVTLIKATPRALSVTLYNVTLLEQIKIHCVTIFTPLGPGPLWALWALLVRALVGPPGP